MTERYSNAPIAGSGIIPSDVENFFDKYSKGMRIVMEGAQADTGQTPKATGWTKKKTKLFRQETEKPKNYPGPIPDVLPLNKRPDRGHLAAGNRLHRNPGGEGFDVYMLDWGIPGDED